MSRAEMQRAYRERRDADPSRRQQYLQKEHNKYRKDLQCGKQKRAADIQSKQELRKVRRNWKIASVTIVPGLPYWKTLDWILHRGHQSRQSKAHTSHGRGRVVDIFAVGRNLQPTEALPNWKQSLQMPRGVRRGFRDWRQIVQTLQRTLHAQRQGNFWPIFIIVNSQLRRHLFSIMHLLIKLGTDTRIPQLIPQLKDKSTHPAEYWTIFSCFFLNLGSICSMYVLCASNPAVAAKSNKPLLLFARLLTGRIIHRYRVQTAEDELTAVCIFSKKMESRWVTEEYLQGNKERTMLLRNTKRHWADRNKSCSLQETRQIPKWSVMLPATM